MASKALPSALLLSLTLLFFTMVSSTTPCSSPPPPPPPPPKTPQCSPPVPKTSPNPPPPQPKTPEYSSPVPKTPPPPPKAPHYSQSPPVPQTPSHSHSNTKCPIDALKLGVCANLLGLVKVEVGSPPTHPCCSLIRGLADLEVAACLCTAIRAKVLGLINLNVPIKLSVLLNNCGNPSSAPDFQCP